MKISSIQENRMSDIKRNLSFSIGELNVIKNDIPFENVINKCLIVVLESQIELLNCSLEVLETIS
jgi:hypothetical protein